MARGVGLGEGPLNWLRLALGEIQRGILIYFLGLNALYFVLVLISIFAILRYMRAMSYRNLQEVLKSKLAPPISVIIPAHNESAGIVSAVKSIFQLNYPEFEIIVVNDGSTDDTLEKLVRAFRLRKTKRVYHKSLPTRDVRGIYASRMAAPWAELVVVDKENGGKADALNAGVNVSRYPLFCSVDADSMLERDSLLRVAMPFMERGDIVGVGGIVRVANGCFISQGVVRSIGLPNQWLPCFQAVEYLRAFLSGRIAWASLRSLLVISGAFSLFKKSAVVEVGGYDRDTVGEDMELVVRLRHALKPLGKPSEVDFVPDPVCWTEVPENLRTLWRQRNRWHRGLAQCLYRHRGMTFNPRYGVIGLVAAPYFWIAELLSPVIEIAGYFVFFLSLLLGSLQWKAFAAFLLLSVMMGINLSLFAVVLEEFTLHRYPRVRDFLRLLAGAVFENIGYRQITTLARLDGILDNFRQQYAEWGTIERKGLDTAA